MVQLTSEGGLKEPGFPTAGWLHSTVLGVPTCLPLRAVQGACCLPFIETLGGYWRVEELQLGLSLRGPFLVLLTTCLGLIDPPI